jgi:2'-5' RNA ligase
VAELQPYKIKMEGAASFVWHNPGSIWLSWNQTENSENSEVHRQNRDLKKYLLILCAKYCVFRAISI